MKNDFRFWFARAAVLLLPLVLSSRVLVGAEPAQDKQRINPHEESALTPAFLKENQEHQIEVAKSWKVFHDFEFENRREQSGISFEQHPVDDASKTYMAVHYDHGNGVAAADVDNDGRLDVYFVNQVGGNQLWRNMGAGK